MKKHVWVAIAAILLALALWGCQRGEATALSLTREEISVKPGVTLDVSKYVVREGGGKLSYAVENTDVLSVKGSKITAKQEGEGAVLVSSGDFVARLRVVVTLGNKVSLAFRDSTVVYDGKEHRIDPVGVIPEGTEITYLSGGKAFFGATDVGTYVVTAVVKVPEGYVLSQDSYQATLTIIKGRYDFSGVTFSNRTFTYDGTEKAVFLTGVLPEGISVTYENNRATEAGTYIAKAHFAGGDANYEELSDLSCKFVIEPRVFSLAEHGFGDVSKTYDGEGTPCRIDDLPQGVTAAFFADKNGSAYDGNAAKDAGTYRAYARLTASEAVAKNYVFTSGNAILSFTKTGGGYVSDYAERTLTIEKAALEAQRFVVKTRSGAPASGIAYGQSLGKEGEDADVVFSLEGDGPVGAKGEFSGRFETVVTLPETNDFGNVDSGSRFVTATYVMPEGYDKNYRAAPTVRYDFTIAKAPSGIGTVAFTFTYTERTFDGTEDEIRLTGVDEEVFETTISIKRDGYDATKVQHAGAYVLTAYVRRRADAANYENVEPVRYELRIDPIVVDLGDVTFTGGTYTYDGEAKRALVEGDLPEGVVVTYSPSSAFTDAGTYTITAKFSYVSGVALSGDYRFVKGEEDAASLQATLAIGKATYDGAVVAGIAAKTGLRWSYGMKYEDVEIVGENARWKTPSEEIGAMLSLDEQTGRVAGVAVYNADPKNYLDYTFALPVTLLKATLDLTEASVPDQFVAKKAGTWAQVYVTGEPKGVRTELTKDGGTYTVTVLPLVPENTYVSGNNVFTGVSVYPYDPDAFTYIAGTTSLRAYRGAATAVVVPSGTTTIQSGAFTDTAVVRVEFPATTERVESGALYGADALTTVVMPDLACVGGRFGEIFGGVLPVSTVGLILTEQTALGDSALENAKMLSSVTIEKPLVSIGDSAFGECTALRELIFDASALVSVGSNAFYRCSALRTLRLPSLLGADGATTLSYYFGNALSSLALETVIFTSKDAYTLADSAFAGANSLKTITLSSGLSGVGASAFRGVSAPVDLTGTAITTLGERAFDGYQGEVVLPVGLLSVGRYAFKDAACAEIRLPASVATIAAYAFSGCTANVRFDESSALTTLGDDAFNGWLGEEIVLPNTLTSLGKKSFYHASRLRAVSLPALREAGESCFEGCSSMTSFDCAATTTAIGAYAFLSCSSLTSFRFYGLTPPSIGSAALNTQGAVLTVYVKNGADADLFRAALFSACEETHFTIARY